MSRLIPKIYVKAQFHSLAKLTKDVLIYKESQKSWTFLYDDASFFFQMPPIQGMLLDTY